MPRSQEFRVILKIQSSYKGAFSEKSCSHFTVNRCGANKEAKTYGHTEDMEAGGRPDKYLGLKSIGS